MPTKDLQKKAKELNEPLPGSMLMPTKRPSGEGKGIEWSLPGSMLPTKDLQEKAKEFNESLPGSMLPSKDLQEKAKETNESPLESLPSKDLHEKANDLESSNRDEVDSLPAKQMRKLLRTLRKHFLTVDGNNYELGSGIQLVAKHIRHYCSECGTPSDEERLGINPLTLLYRLINQCLWHKASHRYTKEFTRLHEACVWSRYFCDADIAKQFDSHVKAFLQADTWTMPWSPSERPRAISLPEFTRWFHVHSGVATATETITPAATVHETDAIAPAATVHETNATANTTQATAIDTPGIATAANDTHATASENAKHKNAGKTVRVNRATRKRKVLLEELASIIAKYGDVLVGMSTNDIEQTLQQVVRHSTKGPADDKADS